MTNNTKWWFSPILFLIILMVVLSLGRKDPTEELTTNIDIINKTIANSDNESNYKNGLLDYEIELARDWLAQNFNLWRLYQNLANPYARYVVLRPGMRKEEVAKILSRELKWDENKKESFLIAGEKLYRKDMEGYYFPDNYLLPRNISPESTHKVIVNRFNEQVTKKYSTSTAEVVNMETALKIASIIEREAAGTRDMRLISGIIWNRIFKNMTLDIDATLQYAKGSERNGWWPKVTSEDKYINSPYNTYKNKGLPPTPISNVGLASINAALNPQKTDCIFYLHDRRGRIHCSISYKEHLANIRRYYK